ncbi:MAG: hypothetical protein ACKVPX_17420 [Myxococcaceae bacterium]
MPTNDSILRYDAALPASQADIARFLRAEIEVALPKALSRVWHGHPVWFDGENPIVGYDARKSSVNILFWNGQALGEPGLAAVGKYRAAGKQFEHASEIDRAELRRCLKKARTNFFDGVTYFRKLREAAKRRKAAAAVPSRGKSNPGKRATKASAKSRRSRA